MKEKEHRAESKKTKMMKKDARPCNFGNSKRRQRCACAPCQEWRTYATHKRNKKELREYRLNRGRKERERIEKETERKETMKKIDMRRFPTRTSYMIELDAKDFPACVSPTYKHRDSNKERVMQSIKENPNVLSVEKVVTCPGRATSFTLIYKKERS